MKKKIGIIGKGHVGAALHQGLERAGYEVKMTGKGDAVRTTAAWAEILILAVPYTALDAALAEIGSAVGGKTLVDVTNVLGPDGKLALGFTTSGAEQLQKKFPTAKVVKAFNTIFAQNMSTGKVRKESLALLAAADDEKAKAEVLEMARAIGFDALDAGPLANARWLESLGYLTIQLGYVINKGLGTGIGFALIR
ncbi:MAG TPA: NAD(P)-binding domain-containing protein [Spirochaetia bacterium]|nr:NAD(P)-binding domain-containing protein [Spirochaetia bacterium]